MSMTLHVLCAGAVKSALMKIVPAFERDTGCTLEIAFDTAGKLLARIAAGETADVLIANRPGLDKLAKSGTVLADTVFDIGHVGVGIAVRDGSPLPDVSTPERLRETLLAAKSIAYGDPSKGDSSGIHFAHVLESLGISDAMKAKSVFAPLGLAVADNVLQGTVELGATQATVIMGCAGISLAGLLPATLQHITTYTLGVPAGSPSVAAARRFADYLATPEAKAIFRDSGFDSLRSLRD
jgi:molybdate transport system substrate-binding protein